MGEGGAGKTTFANKIKNPKYELKEEDTTRGVDVIKWSFSIEKNREFTVNIWDFGGQEIYHATHQFFLTRRSLYALVADTRKEDTDFYYWLNAAELLSENSPLLIVNNEKQDRKKEIPIRLLQSQFSNIKDVLETNLATNAGLDKVRAEVEHQLKSLPHIGTPLPKTWVRVRTALEGEKRNYISLEEFLELCQQNGFSNPKDSLQLSGYLNDIGVFLHFQDDPILKRTVILKPRWGTDAVYKVLDNKKVLENRGLFTRADLESIWESAEYENMRDELLQLMMKFKLCYEIPNQKGSYIAPQLLTENQLAYEWDGNDNLLLRYSYKAFMPKGILTQLIVKRHKDIWDQKYVWKSGVVFEKNRTRAEVIEYYGKREIHMRVSGAHKKDLLVAVMDDLDEIHDSFKRLKYDKLIPCNCNECKNNQEPHFYLHETLLNFIEKRIDEIQCGKSGNMIHVRRLVDDIIGYRSEKEVEEMMAKKRQSQQRGGINVGDNFSGNIIVESNVENSFNRTNELNKALEELIDAVEKMSEKLPEEKAAEVLDDVQKLVDESKKEKPNPKWYNVSIEGLIKAADNLGEVGDRVIGLSKKVLSILTGGILKE